MRFTSAEAMTAPTFYIPLAKAAEAAGYHAMTLVTKQAGSLAALFGNRLGSGSVPAHGRRTTS